MALTPAEQATAQDPTGTATQGEAPWAADLAARFGDEETRQAVDEFLRETVQPHVTRIEQSAQVANELLQDFAEKPEQTLAEIASEVYEDNPEKAKAVAAVIAGTTVPETVQEPARTEQPNPEAPTLDPRVEALLKKNEEEEQKAAFLSEFERVSAANPDAKLDFDLFIPFVRAAGDFDQAAKDYIEFSSKFGEPVEPVTDPAPVPLGTGEAQGAGTTSTEESYTSIGEAIEAFAAEQRESGNSSAPAPPQAT
jgi:hypothetical protein